MKCWSKLSAGLLYVDGGGADRIERGAEILVHYASCLTGHVGRRAVSPAGLIIPMSLVVPAEGNLLLASPM
jgi:hypothetical protein